MTGPPAYYPKDNSTSLTNSTTSTIKMKLSAQQQERVNVNTRRLFEEATIKGHNSRLAKFINFISLQYRKDPSFITGGTLSDVVRKVKLDSVPDKSAYLSRTAGRSRWYRSYDLVWRNVTPEMVNLFYTEDKYNCKYENGFVKKNSRGEKIMLGFDARRKYFDALIYGRKLAKEEFNRELEIQKPMIMKALKVANAEHLGSGQVEESDADPIPRPMCERICQYAIGIASSFWWLFTLLQWNCMARSQNIDNLKFTNLKVADDSIVVTFNQTKKDKEGKRTTPKHCYANPFKWHFCLFTALAVFLCELNLKWTRNKKYLFVNEGSKEGSAASSYCEKIREWACENIELVKTFIRPDRCNAHGIRKGNATEATANTSETSIASVFHRGEWSLGTILDIYWKFAQRGDQFLGRFLCGLDPDSVNYDVLPPHFTVTREDRRVQEAMELCFGNILRDQDENSFLTAVCYLCLPSLIFHENEIQKEIAKKSGHAWRNLPIFQNRAQLKEFKTIVTIEPTPGILEKATGIGKYTIILKQMKRMTVAFEEQKEVQRNLPQQIKASVREEVETIARENGNLTYQTFIKIMDDKFAEHESNNNEKVETILAEIKDLITNYGTSEQNSTILNNAINDSSTEGRNNNEEVIVSNFETYSHAGDNTKVYFVPEGYSLTNKTTLESAFRLFVNGDLGYNKKVGDKLINQPVRPFYYWSSATIPKAIWIRYKSGWRKILHMMINCTDLAELKTKMDNQEGLISNLNITSYYEKGLAYVHSQVEYIKFKKLKCETWSVTTWNRKISYSTIDSEGTEHDKKRLPPATHHNKEHAKRRKLKKIQNS